MTLPATVQPAEEIFYPDSDGMPVADNSVQLRWIFVLLGNLSARFTARPDVLVGSDMLWYAREGDPNERCAPDVFVVFGRPKGDRGSYKQWEEHDVPITVVFEIRSPSNGPTELARKLIFYDEYGVEEYYDYDPDENELTVYLRGREALVLQPKATEFVSPRLGIKFDLTGTEMVAYYPDGERFLTFEELYADRAREREQRLEAERTAEQAHQAVEQAHQEAEQARLDLLQAQLATERAENDALQMRDTLARMRLLRRKARLQQATAEELQELERLEEPDPDEP